MISWCALRWVHSTSRTPTSPVRQKLGSLHPWDFSIRQAFATMWIRRGVVWDSEDGNGWFSQCLPCSYDLRNKCLLPGRSEKWLVPLSPLALEIIKVHGLNLSSPLPIFQSCFPPVSATGHEIWWKFKFPRSKISISVESDVPVMFLFYRHQENSYLPQQCLPLCKQKPTHLTSPINVWLL